MKQPFPTLFTIGSSGTSADNFFRRLREAGVREVIDVRLRRSSQLAGFARHPDLAYFLESLGGIAYRPAPELAPFAELLDRYRAKALTWAEYAHAYVKLLRERNAIASFTPIDLDHACLLCAEYAPAFCHRRLAAEEFAAVYPSLAILHL